MSLRQFRNVVDDTLELPNLVDASSSDEEPTLTPANPFALLEECQTVNTNEEEESFEPDVQTIQTQDGRKQGQRNRNRNKNRRNKSNNQNNNATQNKKKRGRRRRGGRNKGKEKEEDIDEILKQFAEEHPYEESQGDREKEEVKRASLLAISPECLDSEVELAKLFGAKIVAAQRKETGFRNKSGNHLLVQPKDNWPPFSSVGLEMKLVETKKGCHYFCMEWQKKYKAVQDQYFMCVESYDPNNLVQLLGFSPYHVDTLLQLCAICTQTREYEQASDFLERALYHIENCFHPLFRASVLNGTARLQYQHEKNRSFFLAVFRFIEMLGKRGCSRTALEFCKLLLSLDPTDPLALLLSIDYYSLRCKEYEYLTEFNEKWKEECVMVEEEKEDKKTNKQKKQTQDIPTPSTCLPNWAYSIALASILQNKPREEINTNLKQALLNFPMMLNPLLVKCNAKMNTKYEQSERDWMQIQTHDFFSKSYFPNLLHIVHVYVDRTFALWKSPKVLERLQFACCKVLDFVENKQNKSKLDEFILVRQNPFLCSEAVTNHILLTELREAIAELPSDAKRHFEIYTTEVVARPATTNNPLALFLQTLLPWNQVPNAPAIDEENLQIPDWLAEQLPNIRRILGNGQNNEEEEEEDNTEDDT
eukprot:CAMPEP_0174252178 /NCGR_PEP_ID=MMETSP0439-20130205/1762_1 /TAXON_ID=0 /ORGANISM="Stereomyxa ramosa, Strain Chinc5" /LENGTH=647 /DNA_ID=CAMNT_0015332679 /DNA_START=61 /DNA_END=2004 /DNA_ORIENTATION=+